jgi:hypothetical protein
MITRLAENAFFFMQVVLGLLVLYIAARLVFYAYFKTKKDLRQGGKNVKER